MARHATALFLHRPSLVALRFRRIRTPVQGDHYAAVEYTPVSWHRRTKLTVNLAIWALGCMGMNDGHREMETADGKNLPLDRMARLTWWKHDPKANVYQNVISKRQIPGSEWKPAYEKFVHLTEQAGNSFTSAFEAGHINPPPPLAAPSAASRPAASSTLREKECVINQVRYMATYSSNDKKWKVKIKGKEYLIHYDKRSTVNVGGETLEVSWVKS